MSEGGLFKAKKNFFGGILGGNFPLIHLVFWLIYKMNFDTKASTIIFVIFQMKVIFQQNVFSTHLCLLEWKTYGCSHNQMSQKGCWMTKKNIQNWANIYVLSFKTMVIMTSYCFFIHMNVKEFKPKIHLIKF